MQYVETGNAEGKTLMLLPGTGCTYELNFVNVLDSLAEKYHLICVNYDGFETEPALRRDFTDMLTIAEQIEDYVAERHGGRIDGAYGSSLGGSFVGKLFERNRIHIDHGFLGGSDLDESGRLFAWLMTRTFGRLIENSCRNEKSFERFKRLYMRAAKDDSQAVADFLQLFSDNIRTTKPGTLCQEFYSDYVTRLGRDIDVPHARVHVIYAAKMGEAYLKRYHLHFKNPDIHAFDMSHEMWLFSPEYAPPVLSCIDECMQMPV